MNLKFSWILLVILSLSIGCGKNGPDNYKLSGTITYKGNPVPQGEVFLRPVGGGPGGFGFIKDGKYETVKNKGFQGGMSKITFHGISESNQNDGLDSGGKSLFAPYTIEIELPKKDHVHDVEVPDK